MCNSLHKYIFWGGVDRVSKCANCTPHPVDKRSTSGKDSAVEKIHGNYTAVTNLGVINVTKVALTCGSIPGDTPCHGFCLSEFAFAERNMVGRLARPLGLTALFAIQEMISSQETP